MKMTNLLGKTIDVHVGDNVCLLHAQSGYEAGRIGEILGFKDSETIVVAMDYKSDKAIHVRKENLQWVAK